MRNLLEMLIDNTILIDTNKHFFAKEIMIMKWNIFDDGIMTDAEVIDKYSLTLTSAGMFVIPYGFSQKENDIEVESDNGYISDQRVIDIFRLRGLTNNEIKLLGPFCKNATIYYMILAKKIDKEAEEKIMSKYNLDF